MSMQERPSGQNPAPKKSGETLVLKIGAGMVALCVIVILAVPSVTVQRFMSFAVVVSVLMLVAGVITWAFTRK